MVRLVCDALGLLQCEGEVIKQFGSRSSGVGAGKMVWRQGSQDSKRRMPSNVMHSQCTSGTGAFWAVNSHVPLGRYCSESFGKYLPRCSG